MKTITIFETSWCPYCKLAHELIHDLKNEHPEFQSIQVDFIDEEEYPEQSTQYDYYYVPTIFYENTKMHEGVPTKEIYQDILTKISNRNLVTDI